MAVSAEQSPEAGARHAGIAGAPRVPLALVPTPLHRAERLERRLGVPPLYVKRDDLTGFALGGNKVRKLEYLLGDARQQGCDVLVTGGGPGSNHCVTAAAAARVTDMACVLVLYGDQPTPEPVNLTLARQFGADVRFTGDTQRRSVDQHLPRVGDALRAEGRRPYVVPRGGATPVGTLAFAEAAGELARQLDRCGVVPQLVLVATGSGGTQAGLLAGAIAADVPWRIVGASVSRSLDVSVARVATLAGACADRLAARHARPDEVIMTDARGPAHGQPSVPGERCAHLAAVSDGILLDPVYTAKALATLPDVVDGRAPVVFWHTGGTAVAVAAAATRVARSS